MNAATQPELLSNPTPSGIHPDEWAARVQLAACYRIFAMLGWWEMIFNHITVRLPDSDRVWATVGAGYQVNRKLSIDVSYAHIFAKNGTIAISSPANPAFNPLLGAYFGNTRGHVDILSAALNYRWDDPTVTADGPPKGAALVRKY